MRKTKISKLFSLDKDKDSSIKCLVKNAVYLYNIE